MAFKSIIVAACACLAVVSFNVSAAIIYSETFTPNTGQASDVDVPNYVASDFMSLINDTVSSVSWQGLYVSGDSPPTSDVFRIDFYSDNNGSVGGLIDSFHVGNAVNRTGTGQFFDNSFEYFSYQADIGAGIDVLLGSRYWISIFNDTRVDASNIWFWSTNTDIASPGLQDMVSSDGITWLQRDLPHYYELSSTSAVPVPAAVWLFSSGLLGLIRLARRKTHI